MQEGEARSLRSVKFYGMTASEDPRANGRSVEDPRGWGQHVWLEAGRTESENLLKGAPMSGLAVQGGPL